MSNKTQKIQKAQESFFTKVMLISFYFIMICYSQCGYAVIEEYLIPGTGGFYKLGTEVSSVKIDSMELATEVVSYLKNGRLREVYIRLPRSGEQDNIRQLILEELAEALRSNTALTTLYLQHSEIGDEGARTLAEALLNNTVLTTLCLGGNQIGAKGARALAEALRNNMALTMLDLKYNQLGSEGARELATALTDNYTLLKVISDDRDPNEEPLIRNSFLIKLLYKVKRASSFTFAIGFHHTPLRYVTQAILTYAGLSVRNRTAFENIQDYNTGSIRDIIFKGSLGEVIRLFYYGSDADYGEILQEVNQIRWLQREILQDNQRVIPQGLIELPEELSVGAVLNMTQEERKQQRRDFVTASFWNS